MLIFKGGTWFSWLFHWYWIGTYHQQHPEVRSDEVVLLWCHQPFMLRGRFLNRVAPHIRQVWSSGVFVWNTSQFNPHKTIFNKSWVSHFPSCEREGEVWAPWRVILGGQNASKRFWGCLSLNVLGCPRQNLQQAPKLWRISKSSILIYIGLISPRPGNSLRICCFRWFFSPKPSFSERGETFQNHDVRNFGEIWWMRMKASESKKRAKNPWCFEHGTCVKSEASDKDTKDNPFLPNEKKTGVSYHFFFLDLQQEWDVFLKFSSQVVSGPFFFSLNIFAAHWRFGARGWVRKHPAFKKLLKGKVLQQLDLDEASPVLRR